jgi:hypothetical protein
MDRSARPRQPAGFWQTSRPNFLAVLANVDLQVLNETEDVIEPTESSMNNSTRSRLLHLVLVPVLFWLASCVAMIGFQVIFLSPTHKVDADWWLFCIFIAIIVIFSASGIAIVRRRANDGLLAHLAGGVAGSVIVFIYLGFLAGGLSQQGFIWIYVPIGVVPGVLYGLISYSVRRRYNAR